MCGKVEERLNRALIEGVELCVCSGCSRFGKVLAPLIKNPVKAEPKNAEKEEKIELLVEGYADIIKRKREAMGLSQKDFAAKLNEKESTIHKIETKTLEPPFPLVKKLEKLLGVKLIAEHHEKRGTFAAKGNKEQGFTLGDFIKSK